MISTGIILTLIHLCGLALGIGAATVKLTLLLKCRKDHSYVTVFNKVARPITKIIITGLILLTLSGTVWMFQGASWTPILIVKLVLVVILWLVGPYIDNVVEPRFRALSPESGQNAGPDFNKILNKYLTVEILATFCFYVITFMGIVLYE